MKSSPAEDMDARFLAQERIIDALLRTLALRQPSLLDDLRAELTDTEFSHPGKPKEHQTVHEQIRKRLDAATAFAGEHGAEVSF